METTYSWNVMNQRCPTRQVLDRVADRWTLLVICALEDEPVLRFSELRRRIEGISQKMLTQTLRGLERDGLIERSVYPTVPVTVEYRLTELGRGLSGTVATLREWSYANIERIQDARALYDGDEVRPVAQLNAR